MYSWGDQTSWKGFMTHLLRREYGTFQLGADSIAFSSPLITKLSLYARHILAQTIYISVPIAFLGTSHSIYALISIFISVLLTVFLADLSVDYFVRLYM